MKRLIIATLLLGSISPLPAQKSMKIPAVYKPVKTEKAGSILIKTE